MHRLHQLSVLQLRCLVELAEGRTMTVVADRLHLSGSQVSRLVSQAESVLGFALFTRKGPKIAPNEVALSLAPRLRGILESLVDCVEEGRQVLSGASGRIHLGYTPLTALTGLPLVLREVAVLSPKLSLTIESGRDAEIEAGVGNGNFELGILTLPMARPDLRAKAIHVDPLRVAVPSSLGLQAPVSLANPVLGRILIAPRMVWPGTMQRVLGRCEQLRIRPVFDESVNDALGRLALVPVLQCGAIVSKVREKMLPEGVELLEIEGMGDVGFTTALIAPQNPTLITRQVWDSLPWEETAARVE
jgi:DNA-binding transcriptional LysR family regulator